jgi:signal transduction histidine kinase
LNELLEQRVVAEAQERVRIWDAARREISEISRHLTMASMVASISHEVSQPLAAVILNADTSLQLLAKPKPDMDDVRAALKDIVDGGQRARAVLDGKRSWSKDHCDGERSHRRGSRGRSWGTGRSSGIAAERVK